MTIDNDYEAFVARKLSRQPPTGLSVVPTLGDGFFPHQSDLASWSLRRGRAAVFADTGLGKSRIEIAYGRAVADAQGGPVLILAPLAVAPQTVGEGKLIGMDVVRVNDGAEVDARSRALYVTNYDRLHRFDPSVFAAVILDESGCIKHHDAKTFRTLTDAFARTPFKLCGTATPAPNDWTELGTHAEFLGICSRQEMLAEYFVHDGGETQKWRLKGHARAQFWRWVASWAALVRRPSDLGYSDKGYDLPPLEVHQHTLPADRESVRKSGLLFPVEARGLSERRAARRGSLSARVVACVEDIRRMWNDCPNPDPWLIWCDLNDEQDELERLFGDEAFSVRGANTTEEKEDSIARWLAGERPVMISKASIMGWGLNFQHCAHMAFVGVTDSWEAYYQAVRRVYRFGQRRKVQVHIYASELEGSVVANLRRKEQDALAMAEALSAETRDAVRAEVRGSVRQTIEYEPGVAMVIPEWLRTEESA